MTETRKAPISSHPAFRWGVGAWFALLLGLGLFVMPAPVHQAVGDAIGLSGTLPAGSLRLALSGIAALLGFALGLVLALRVAKLNLRDEPVPEPEPAAEEDGDNDAPLDGVWLSDDDAPLEAGPPRADAPRRPFNPLEDMEEAGIGAEEREYAAYDDAASDDPDRESALMELWREEMGDDVPMPLDSPAPLDDAEDALFEEVGGPEAAPYVPAPEPEADDPGPFADEHSYDEDALPPSSHAASESDALPEPGLQARQDPEPETEAKAAADAPTDAVVPQALGDLSLDALTDRLSAALEAASKKAPAQAEETDPVIAFLRREADRDAPGPRAADPLSDPQAELRSALDKLSRVGKPE